MVTMIKHLVLVLVVACGAPQTSTARQGLTGTSDCVDPRDFGAIIGDGLDDRVPMQAAINDGIVTGRPLCAWTGEYHVTKPPGTGLANIASLTISGDGFTIAGRGDSSRVVMLGGAAGDWWVFRVTGSNHTLRNFSIDGAGRGMTTEQTHLIQVWGPAQDITIESMRVNLPSLGDSTGGDCIRAAGEQAVGTAPATPVIGLVIDKVRGIDCDRSFVGLQRWVFGVRITNSSSQHVGDQAIDFEATGFGTIGDVAIRDCRFRRNGLGDAAALSIQGGAGGAPPGYDVTVEHTAIDGAIVVFNSGSVVLRDVRAIAQGASPTLDIRKDSAHVTVEGGYYEHFGSAAAPVVSLSFHTSAWPRYATIHNAHLVQRSGDHVVRAEPAQGLVVRANEIECLGPTANTFAAVQARATVADVIGVQIVGNTVTGNCKQLARFSSTASFGVRTTKVLDNEASVLTQGVFFENAAPLVKPVVDGNTLTGILPANYVIGAGAVGYWGDN